MQTQILFRSNPASCNPTATLQEQIEPMAKLGLGLVLGYCRSDIIAPSLAE